MGARKVAGEDASGEAEFGVVGALDHLVLAVELEHAHHRPENLLTRDAHAVGDVGEHRRLDEEAAFEALQRGHVAAAGERRPVLLAGGDVGNDLVLLRLVDQRTHLRFRIERIADTDLFGALDQPLDEAVMQALLHEDARAVGADLTGRIEIAEHGAADGIFEVGIVEDDQRRLAAELHRGVLHLRAGKRQHLAAGRHRTGHRNFCHHIVPDKPGADIAIALHYVEQPVGQAGLAVDLGKRQRRKRRVLRRLEHHGVAHGQRRRRLPAGDLDRIVPGANADAHPKRFTPRIGKGSAEVDHLAIEGGDRAGEIFQAIGG